MILPEGTKNFYVFPVFQAAVQYNLQFVHQRKWGSLTLSFQPFKMLARLHKMLATPLVISPAKYVLVVFFNPSFREELKYIKRNFDYFWV